MGYYINPSNMTKEQYLIKHGKPIVTKPTFDQIADCSVLVCLINNGFFTAAGIAFNEAELETFRSPDGRPKLWYLLSKEDAMAASDWKGQQEWC